MYGTRKVRGAGIAVSIALALGIAPAAHAALNGFDGGDGNQSADCSSTPLDWQCLAVEDLLTAGDGTGAVDDAFGDGSKEQQPSTWTFVPRAVLDKVDVRGVWTSVAPAAEGRIFLNLAFKRQGGTGDAYLGIELNQSRSEWTNSFGTQVPCRSDGDVLISYEVSNPTVVRLYAWDGTGGPDTCPDGATGTWKSDGKPLVGVEAAMNEEGPVENFLDLGSFGPLFGVNTFGEASLDLRTIAQIVHPEGGCAFFRQVSVKTRSSSSLDAQLQDWVMASRISARACGIPDAGDAPPAAPTITGPATAPGRAVPLSGTAEPGSTVTVWDGNAPVGFATTDAGGNWSLVLDGVSTGAHSYTAETTDAAGNTSPRSGPLTVQVDATPPAAPALSASASGSDVTLSGTAEPGSTVTVYEGTAVLGTTTADATGAWSLELEDVGDGTHTYSADATDAVGNTSPLSAPVTIVVDGTAPAAPTLDSSLSASDVTLSGTAEPGSTVTVYDGSVEVGTATADATGAWTLVLEDVTDGSHSYTAEATDLFGNTSAPSAPSRVQVDTTAPTVPTLGASVNGSDVTLSGTAEPGSTVTVYDGSVIVGTATADATGAWSLELEDVGEGSHSYTAEVTDAAGNTSPRSAPAIAQVDITPPAAPTLAAATSSSDVTLSGIAQPNSSVTISEGSTVVGTVVADATGAYSLPLSGVPAGTHTYAATATDPGGTSPASKPATATIAAPADPTPTTGATPTPTPTPTPDATPDASPTTGTTTGSPATPAPAEPALPVTTAAPAPGTETSLTQGSAVGTASGLTDVTLAAGSPRLKECVAKRFKAHVTLKGVRRATFAVDGRVVRTVRKANRAGHFVATIDPAKLGLTGSNHRVTARVTFRNRKRKARTVGLRFRRCDTCQSRRAFRIRVKNLRHGERAVRAIVFVNGKRTKVVRGKRLRAKVVLTGLPKGTFRVRIRTLTNRGRTVTDTRRYRTCVKKQAKRP